MNKQIKLDKDMLYSRKRGYGFITEPIRDLEKILKIPELNSGFDILYWYMDSEITRIMEDENGCYAVGVLENGSVTPVNVPLFFKMDVESEGNYLFTLTESFRDEGHYDILTRLAKPGDIVLFQFGHNDQKLPHLKAEEGYRDNLIRYIAECRDKGIFPIIVTPLSRNTWREDGTHYVDLLVDYDKVCKQIGEEYEVPIIDLHGRSKDFILKNGIEVSKQYFYPGDYTHSNDFGGFLFASFVADEMRSIPELAKYLINKPKNWIPDESLVLLQKPENPVYEIPPGHASGFQIPFSGVFAKSPSDVTKELEFLCGFSGV